MRTKTISALLIALGFFPAAAHAEAVCGKRTDFVGVMAKKYNETPKSVGIAAGGSLFEIYTSPEGTFTVLISKPGGISCVVAAGNSFENVPQDFRKLTGL
jgi:hypothetical protein